MCHLLDCCQNLRRRWSTSIRTAIVVLSYSEHHARVQLPRCRQVWPSRALLLAMNHGGDSDDTGGWPVPKGQCGGLAGPNTDDASDRLCRRASERKADY